MEERFFISPSCYAYREACYAKALELLLEAEVEPPIYVSIDIVNNKLIATAINENEYKKFIGSDEYQAMKVSYYAQSLAAGNDITLEEIDDMAFWLLPLIVEEESSCNLGETSISKGSVAGATIFISTSTMEDVNKSLFFDIKSIN